MKRFIDGAVKIIFSRILIIFLMVIVQIAVLLFSFLWLGAYFSYIWEGMYILGDLLIIYIINRDEPTEFKISWIIPICLFPVLGALSYLFVISNAGGLGLKRKMNASIRDSKWLLNTSQETQKALKECPPLLQGFVNYMEKQAGFPAYHNSGATYYPLGENKYDDLLKELEKAEEYIFLEYFIVERGIMWDAILEVLKRKADEGVEVRVMYDGMCSILLLPYRYPAELQKYGIQAKMFAPIIPFLSTSQNNRDHRKIVVIDGKVAFTGGVNLADEYINQREKFGHWKDVAVKVTGEAVRSFTLMFLQMWNMSEPISEDFQKYLRYELVNQPMDYGGFVIPYGDTPTRKEAVAKTVYQSMVNNATRYVHIMTPYFIVEREFIDCMRYAAERGVEVAMILPHIPDKRVVFYIARTYYPELLRAGVKVYEYTPGFVHAKVFVSDDLSATVGTVNLDYRSFYHHFECGVFFYDNIVIGDVERDFEQTREKCVEVTMEYYKKLPVHQKILGSIFKLFAPLM